MQLVTWSNELEPIKILSSSQCTLWGKKMNENLKIEINYQGESAQIKLNARRLDRPRRDGSLILDTDKKNTSTIN